MATKHFTYKLYPIAPGAEIAPSGKLPDDAIIGIASDTPYYFYGKADIASLDVIQEFQPEEVPEAEYNFFAEMNASSSFINQVSGSVELSSDTITWTLTK